MKRTRQNVLDSDGTLIITFGRPSGGTSLTVAMCREAGIPMLIVDGAIVTASAAARAAADFVRAHDIRCLNVAGPRASREPRSYPFTLALVNALLAGVARGPE